MILLTLLTPDTTLAPPPRPHCLPPPHTHTHKQATKVRVCPDGTVQNLMSWPSWGPEEDDTPQEDPTAAAAAGGSDAPDAMPADTTPAAAVAAAAATAAGASAGSSPVAVQHNSPRGLLPLARSGSPPSPRVGSTTLGGKAAAALAAAVGAAAAAGSSVGGASSNTGAAAMCAEPGLGGDEATGGRGLSRCVCVVLLVCM